MDELDTALILAFDRVRSQALEGTAGDRLAELARRAGSKVVSANLRSGALVLRACDSRIPDENSQGVVRVDAQGVKAWCSPVAIKWPGVSLTRASKMFGVNRTTVSRWADPPPEAPPEVLPERVDDKNECIAVDAKRPARDGGGLVGAPGTSCRALRGEGLTGKMPVPLQKRRTWKQDVEAQLLAAAKLHAGNRFGVPSTYLVKGKRLNLEYAMNRANRKRDVVRVWTPRVCGLDPGGAIEEGLWAGAFRGRAAGVPDGFLQTLTRVDRRLGIRARVFQWACPADCGGCGRLVYKLYLPLPMWTIGAALGVSEGGYEALTERAWERGFVCQRCAELVYASSERGSSPGRRVDGGRRKLDEMDRFAKRISGGAVTGVALHEAIENQRKSEN